MGLSCKFEKHRSFKNKVARYSSNFGKKLQMIVGIGVGQRYPRVYIMDHLIRFVYIPLVLFCYSFSCSISYP